MDFNPILGHIWSALQLQWQTKLTDTHLTCDREGVTEIIKNKTIWK